MKRILIVFSFCLALVANAQDLPKNPKPGQCFVRCESKEGQSANWKQISCALVKYNKLLLEDFKATVFSEKDKKKLNNKIVKLLKKGYSLEIKTHYDSQANDSVNIIRSLDKSYQLANFLVKQNINVNRVLIDAVGNTDPIIKCKNQGDCSKAYFENSRYEFRVINVN